MKRDFLPKERFMELPLDAIEMLESSEILLVKGGGVVPPINNGTGCGGGGGPINNGTGCNC